MHGCHSFYPLACEKIAYSSEIAVFPRVIPRVIPLSIRFASSFHPDLSPSSLLTFLRFNRLVNDFKETMERQHELTRIAQEPHEPRNIAMISKDVSASSFIFSRHLGGRNNERTADIATEEKRAAQRKAENRDVRDVYHERLSCCQEDRS